ncbi:lipoprotein ABC transporter ATP-binding protein [Corynebacterium sp. 13CS0277]|uniref:ATP-binding cassette domain-containing protein n=1 Tax=Corynebacterium sp. 13CS0277 TaxID=2071994 RepID=UPI000D029B83|nr:ATP-binding cassette domain-containing protein [Corynebacterium sp. 13CS0277]PRQ11793.1 lipoprotein ABC transporter ATP-binding protein [Corynebacterium sp. 13CS0277]
MDIDLEAVGYRLHDTWILRDITATITPGLTAITGPSGCGKSTLLGLIGGLLEGTGTIRVDGRPHPGPHGRRGRIFRRDVAGWLFQDYGLVGGDTVAANVGLARRKVAAWEIEEALTQVGLARRGTELAGVLSGGEQQRVALARLIVKNPPLILADEPTGSLDTANEDLVLGILRRLGGTVIIATHSPRVVASCDAELRLPARAA